MVICNYQFQDNMNYLSQAFSIDQTYYQKLNQISVFKH